MYSLCSSFISSWELDILMDSLDKTGKCQTDVKVSSDTIHSHCPIENSFKPPIYHQFRFPRNNRASETFLLQFLACSAEEA
ncbi:hypothetical protein E2320_018098, partial [Naja naja]